MVDTTPNDVLPVGIAVLNPDLTVVLWNSALEDWTTVKREQMIGLRAERVFPQFAAPVYREGLTQVIETGKQVSFSSRVKPALFPSTLPDGGSRQFHVVVKPIKQQGTTKNQALLVVQDVSELSHRLEQLNAANTALEEEIAHRVKVEAELRDRQQLIDRVASLTPGVLCLYNVRDQRIIYINERVKTLLGLSEQDSRDLGHEFISRVHPDDLSTFDRFIIRLTRGKDGEIFPSDFRLRHEDGHLLYMQAYTSVFRRDENGNVLEMVSLAHDVSARKQAEERVRSLELEQEYGRVLSNFIQNSSHDLRTPLSSLNIGLHLLRGADDRARRDERIERLLGEVMRLNTMLDDMYRMTRLDHVANLDLNVIHINSIVSSVVSSLQDRFARKHIPRLYTEFASHLPDVMGSSPEIRAAVDAIVENALIYTPAEGTVTLMTDLRGGEVVVEVKDNGPGIPPDDLESIFARFYKVDRARTALAGTGLGLPIARRVMELHGGRLEVQSEAGVGSCFRLIFPVKLSVVEESAS